MWGDGEQTRSFCYVNDCVEGLVRLMDSGSTEPLNLGTDELVSVNQLVDLVGEVAGKPLRKNHDSSKAQGVRGRNSDNSQLRKLLAWEPKVTLRQGLSTTYPWIWSRLDRRGRARPPAPEGVLQESGVRVRA